MTMQKHDDLKYINKITTLPLWRYALQLSGVKKLIFISLLCTVLTLIETFSLIFVMLKLWNTESIIMILYLMMFLIMIAILWYKTTSIKDRIFHNTLYSNNNKIYREVFLLTKLLPYNYTSNLPSESKSKIFTTLKEMNNVVLQELVKPMLELPLLLVTIALTTYILGAIYFSLLVVFSLTIYFVNAILFKQKEDVSYQQLCTTYTGTILDIIKNSSTINLHKQKNRFYRTARDLTIKHNYSNYQNDNQSEYKDIINDFMIIIMYVATLLLAVTTTIDGKMDLLSMFVVVLLTWFIITPAKIFINSLTKITKTQNLINKFTRLSSFLEYTNRHTAIDINNEDFKGNIIFKNIYFQYPNKSEFKLIDINFSVTRGEVLLITGDSGSGKSTIVKLLLGLLNQINGDIHVDINCKFIDQESLAKKIFYYTNQSFLDVLEYGNQINLFSTKQEINIIDFNPAKFKLHSDLNIDNFHNDYYENCHNQFMKKVLKPNIKNSIVIYDEIFLSSSQTLIDEHIEHINLLKNQNNTIILSSIHDKYKKIADKILILNNGSIQRYMKKNDKEYS